MLSDDEARKTDVFYRLGLLERDHGDLRKALTEFGKALAVDPDHRPTLDAIVGAYETLEDWEQVIRYRARVLEKAEGGERARMLMALGDLYREKVRDPEKAIKAYAQASELEPGNRRLLRYLLVLYQQTRAWEEAVAILERLGDLDERALARSKYAHAAAVVLRDQLEDDERALVKFEEALELGLPRAFGAVEEILTQRGDWKRLERVFRRRLHQVSGSGEPDLEYELWRGLGVVYRDRLQHHENAAAAFTMASEIRPESVEAHEVLAGLHALIGGDNVAGAIREHQWLIRRDPRRIESYRKLYGLYFSTRAYDKAWCLAATLSSMRSADAEQERFFVENRPDGPILPQRPLNDERWLKDLAHPEQDLLASKIFEQLWGSVLSLRCQADKQAGLGRAYEVDPAKSTVTFAQTFGFVASVLGLPCPRLFLRTDAPGGLTAVPSWPLASLAGSTLLSGYRPQALLFVIGRHLADYRPEHYIRTMLRTAAELEPVLKAGLCLSGVVPSVDEVADGLANELGPKVQPTQLAALRRLATRFVEAGSTTDLERWLQTVELTACRAGFLVCNDLDAAMRMMAQLPPAAMDIPAADKRKELAVFSVSEAYFRLREHLGIRISLAEG